MSRLGSSRLWGKITVLVAVCGWCLSAQAKYSGGSGTEGEPFRIGAVSDWQELMTTPEDWASHFVLTTDIDLNDVMITPIGNSTSQFTGVFDGNDYVIRNADVNMPGSDNVGLFGYLVTGGQIKNLGVEDVSVFGRNYVGGLVGYNTYDGTISNCYSSGSVSGSSHVGGLVGMNSGTISNCYSTGSVTGTGYYVGGLVGMNYRTISNCYSTGSVSGDEGVGGLVGMNYRTISNCYSTGSVTGDEDVGGLVGWNENGTISNSYSTASVGGDRDVGGLCGLNRYGTITDCYASGTVSGGEDTKFLGGLCGRNDLGAITNCYASGAVTGGDYSESLGGLCGSNSGTITDCYASGTVSGGDSSFIGGLCGSNSGTITGCYATGTVSVADHSNFLGGLCGYNDGGTITACYANGTVSGGDYSFYLGGLVGMNSGTISNCYSSGSASGGSSVGGLCGTNVGTITHCYAGGAVTAGEEPEFLGGLCGANFGMITDCYWNRDSAGVATSAGAWALTDTGMKQAASFLGWNTGQWTIDEGLDYPRLAWENAGGMPINTDYPTRTYAGGGTAADPYQLSTPDDVICLGLRVPDWNSHFLLTADIDLTGIVDYRPVQDFAGFLDGQGHVIRNLTVDAQVSGNRSKLGLLGRLHIDATVTHLGLENVTVTGGDYSESLGGLCGRNDSGAITDCYAGGAVTGGDYSRSLGGLCGTNGGTITHCYAGGAVTGGDYSESLGGLCGDGGTMTDCYASGTVSGGENTEFLGGLVGVLGGNSRTISNCYSTGSVSGGYSVGGLVGLSYRGAISNCYSTGSVTGTGSYFASFDGVGGLVGCNYEGTISNCYSSGSVSGDWRVGGLVGSNDRGWGTSTISNCYFLDTAGPDNGYGTPLTDAQMKQQSSFVGWDFVWEIINGTDDIWMMVPGGYPYPVLVGVALVEVGGVGDLTVISVSTEDTGIAGRPVHVEWDVFNDYTEEKIGPGFLDAVYLSSDREWDINDIILAIIQHNESVEPQTGYHAQADVILPGVLPGRYYVLVGTDFGNLVYEPDGEDNNIASTDANMVVDVEELIIGTPADSNFVHPELSRYFRVTVPAGEDVEIRLDDFDDAGSNELYASFERIATRSQFDYRYERNFASDQTIRIPDTQSGTYYILAYGSNLAGSGQAAFTIGVQYMPLEITEISPASGGNAGTVTATIQGARFKSSTTTKLIGPDGTTITGELHKLSSTMEMIVTFDLEDASEGLYDVEAENSGGETFVVEDAFEVFAGIGPRLEAWLIVPSQVRAGSEATLWLEYGNTGDADMLPPLFKVSNSSNAQMSLSRDQGFQDEPLQLLGISGSEPFDVLPPGMYNRLPAYFRAPDNTVTVDFKLGVLTADSLEAIDWVQFESEVRPADAEPNEWDVVFTRLKSQVGPTWGDYVRTLLENANRWFTAGKRVYRVSELFAMEMAEAKGLPTGMVTGRVTDWLSGQPVAGVTVVLRDDTSTPLHSALTQPNGSFLMESVGPGTYAVAVDRYLLQGDSQIEVIQDVFGLEVQVSRAAEVIGTVLGPSDEPIEEAWVTLSSPGIDPLGAFTDANGWFGFTTVPDGNWVLSVQPEGYVLPEPLPVQIEGPGTRALKVLLVAGASISGLVTDIEGVPLQDADVVASVAGGTSAMVKTDANGQYTLRGLSAGDCLVMVSAEGCVSDSRDIPALELDDALENIDFSMQPGLPVTGQVTEAGTGSVLEGVTLFFFCEDQFVAIAFTDANGNFVTDECYSGQYSVEYSLPGYQPAQESFLLPPEGLQEPLQLTLQPPVIVEESPGILRADFATINLDARTPDLDEKDLYELVQKEEIKKRFPTARSHVLHFILPLGPDINKVPAPCIYHPYHEVSKRAKNAKSNRVTFAKSKAVAEKQIKAKLAAKVCSAKDLPPLYPVKTDPLSFYCSGFPGQLAGCGFCLPYFGTIDLCTAFGDMNVGTCHVVNIYPVKESETAIEVNVVTLYIYEDYYKFEKEHCDQNPGAPWNCWALHAQEAGYATPFHTRIEISDSFTHVISKDKCNRPPPTPPTPRNGGGTTTVVRARDPNKKIGPAGSGSSGLVLPGQLMVYTVHFENEPNASAAALEVRIEDQLDEDLDWTTFELLEIGFGDYAVTIPDEMSHYETRLDVNGWTWSEEDGWHTGEAPLMADISADIDISTGIVTWKTTSYDPNTGWAPEDAYAGFLPPDDANDITRRGEGYMSFAIRPKADSPAGTLITNSARIFFDENPAIETPATSNIVTIDLADLDLSGKIDFGDIARLADEWLWVGLAGTVDEDIVVDGTVNFLDYGKVAEKWLSP